VTSGPADAVRFGIEPKKEGEALMDLSWRLRGACRGLDPEIFFPVSEEDATEPKAICGTCTVQQQCLEFALASRESEGIWGGATEKERRRILRQRRKTAAA
jgi:WhiB family redox-sensing transcriptional regulator